MTASDRNPYAEVVAEWARIHRRAKSLPLGGLAPPERPSLGEDAPVLLVVSPHPDDEVIVGGLALRLRREAGWRIVNVPLTLGSNRARRFSRIARSRSGRIRQSGWSDGVPSSGSAPCSAVLGRRSFDARAPAQARPAREPARGRPRPHPGEASA